MPKSNEVVEAIFEKTNFLILVLGILLVVLGASGGITLSSFSLVINELAWRVLICLVGLLLFGLSLILIWKETFKGITISSKKTEVKVWNVEEFKKRLIDATELCMVTVSNQDLLFLLLEDLKSFVKRGGKIRCLYMKPEGHLLEMVAARSIDVDQDINALQMQYDMSLKAMHYIAESALIKDSVQVKNIGYFQGVVLTLVNPTSQESVAYVTLNGFGHHYASRPCITLSKKHASEWFTFFQETFNNMWSSPLCEDVNLFELKD